MKTCSIEGCETKVLAKGWCRSHYRRNANYGNPLGTAQPHNEEASFWARVNKTEGCWLWTGGSRGVDMSYGSMRVNGKSINAHRYSYALAFGPIPEGMVIDHKCHVRKCVRPTHLQTVTIKQNAENRRGATRANSAGVRGVCWSKASKKWKGTVGHNYKRHHVGFFESLQEAEAAVIAKRNELYTNNLEDRKAA